MTTNDYYKLIPDQNGWRTLPNGNIFRLGYNVTIDNNVTIGHGVIIGNDAEIGFAAVIGYNVTIGNYAIIGNGAGIGNCATIGNYAKIGHGAKIGNGAGIGNYAKIGHGAKIGNHAQIGELVIIKDGQTTKELNRYFIRTYPPKSIFWKWVTRNLMSPGWGNGKPIQYEIEKTISVPDAQVSDKQCDVGLHIFRPGIRPEFVGLYDPDHNLICLEVEVNREDICFGGLPGNSDKIRVKKLKVLRKVQHLC